ncbi:hypothetical protein CWE13_11145 [Aliidiomarina shirensis]|uniref:Uncharacterized protein n=1 Tax=Aliidiomarina shirensis TaxID=1048642 RepID=A0A432WP14_9GAMM|nr:hypothetical protein [Aliidiomarina shirensis]RUO35478.1 hypothetical protein CWE13_11145 [Aliidiomarina shirensis]
MKSFISYCLAAAALFFHASLFAIELPEQAQELRQEAEKIRSKSPWFAQIWPGFWPESEPFIVFNSVGETLLFTTDEPLPGYEAKHGHYYFYSERLPNTTDFAYFINYPLPNNQLATAVRIHDLRGEVIDTLLHEAFHGYQRLHFSKLHASSFLDPSYFSEPTVRGLLRFQFSLAQKAHAEQGEEQSEALVRDWLTFRAGFEHAIAKEVGELLASFEHLEGTAHWVGVQAAYAEHSRNQLGDFLRHFQARFDNSNHVRTSAYATGAFLVDILNEYSPDDYDWRAQLEAGNTPLALAIALFEIDPETAMNEMNALFERHDASAYIQAAAEPETHNNVVKFANVRETYPYSLSVTLTLEVVEGRAELPLRFSAGEGGFENLSNNVIFIPDPGTFQIDYKNTTIDIRGLPALADLQSVGTGKLRIQVWSETPIVSLSELIISEPLVLEFGDSAIRSGRTWHASSEDQHTIAIEIE